MKKNAGAGRLNLFIITSFVDGEAAIARPR
jgi:hypothetical protein